jgi:hypothetical protein
MVEVEVCIGYNKESIERQIKSHIELGYKLQGYSSIYNYHSGGTIYSAVMVKE